MIQTWLRLQFKAVEANWPITGLLQTRQYHQDSLMGEKTLYEFKANNILGSEELDFDQFRDKVVIVVNGASACGYTKSNYAGLSTLLDRYYADGLRVLLFPCNQFGHQEREEPTKIKAFVEGYDKRFVLAEKINVNGNEAHPLFDWLKHKCPGFLIDAIKWNFTKVSLPSPVRTLMLFSF